MPSGTDCGFGSFAWRDNQSTTSPPTPNIESTMALVLAFYSALKVKDLIPAGQVITGIPSSVSVADASTTLRANRISGAPVLSAEGQVSGFVDSLDVSAFLAVRTVCLLVGCLVCLFQATE